jgi:hypothetical protein
MTKPTRKPYGLTPEEITRFSAIRPVDGTVWTFWRSVALARELDYTTIMGLNGNPHRFTALPLGHGQAWCYPSPLKLLKRPMTFDEAA